MKDKKYWKRELKDVDVLYVAGVKRGTTAWDRGIWRKFRVYYIKNGVLKQIYIEGDDHPACWVPLHQTPSGRWRGGYFEAKVLGSDRVYEIAYSLQRWLGRNKPFRTVFLSYEE